jgi:hypothetical protein
MKNEMQIFKDNTKYVQIFKDNTKCVEIKKEKKSKANKETKTTEFLNHRLKKGKYDIDFLINVLMIIRDKNKQSWTNPQQFRFTLDKSLDSLIRFLEVEKMPASGIYHDPLQESK